MNNKLQALLSKIEIHSPLAEELSCCKCQELLLDPKQTLCGHLFCSRCLSFMFISGKAVCPVDNKSIDKDEIFKDSIARRQVYQLQVSCPNKQQGCTEICCLQDLVEHVEKCQWQLINCPQGCQMMILSKQLLQHLQTGCSERHITCEYCSSDVVYSKMEEHFNDCQLLMISCPFQCNVLPQTREQMNIHMKSCPQKPVICKFSHLGCRFQGFKENILEHESDSNYHLNLFLVASMNQTAYMNATVAEMKSEIKELQNENLILKNQLETADKFQQCMRMHLEQLSKKLVHLQLSVNSDTVSEDVKSTTTCFHEDIREEIQKMEESVNNLEQKVKLNCISTGNLEESSLQHDNQLAQQNMSLTDLNVKLQKLEMTSYNGLLIWKINDFSRRKQESIKNNGISIYSTPFYTDQYGYKMCVQLIPPHNKNAFISVYLVLMKSKMDAVLVWPFQPRVTFMLLDQKRGTDHLISVIKADQKNSFVKPTKDISNSLGIPDFVSLHKLETSDRYLIQDTIFIKVIVEST